MASVSCPRNIDQLGAVGGPPFTILPVGEAGPIRAIEPVDEQILAGDVALIRPSAILRRPAKTAGIVTLQGGWPVPFILRQIGHSDLHNDTAVVSDALNDPSNPLNAFCRRVPHEDMLIVPHFLAACREFYTEALGCLKAIQVEGAAYLVEARVVLVDGDMDVLPAPLKPQRVDEKVGVSDIRLVVEARSKTQWVGREVTSGQRIVVPLVVVMEASFLVLVLAGKTKRRGCSAGIPDGCSPERTLPPSRQGPVLGEQFRGRPGEIGDN